MKLLKVIRAPFNGSAGAYLNAIRSGRRGLTGTARTAALVAKARAVHGIGPIDFILYAMASRPEREWSDYIGEVEFRELARSLSTRATRRLARDKLRFHDHCRAHGISSVPILGIIAMSAMDPSERRLDSRQLTTLLEQHDSLFLKRVEGSYGDGALHVRRAGDRVRFAERTGTADELIAHVTARNDGAYLVQPVIRMHPDVQAIMSPHGVGTARIITCMVSPPRKVIGAALRITVGENITDNFVHGSSGNLIAGIDVATGQLFSCFGARSPGSAAMVAVDRHPDTGNTISGRQLPDWDAALSLIHSAGDSLPELPLVGWDVAFTTSGPVLLEVNALAGLQGMQVALRRGIRPDLAEAFRAAARAGSA